MILPNINITVFTRLRSVFSMYVQSTFRRYMNQHQRNQLTVQYMLRGLEEKLQAIDLQQLNHSLPS
jgi:glutamine synthetase adenylyltransferase